jgi:hypothetical protein
VVSSAAFGAELSVANTWSDFVAQMACPSSGAGSVANSVNFDICEKSQTSFCNTASPDRAGCTVTMDPIAGADFEAKVADALKSCQSYAKPASDCCGGNGSACGAGEVPGSVAGGMEAICKDLAANSKVAKDFNTKVAGICLGRKERCVTKCYAAYKNLKDIASVSGAASANLEKILDQARACDNLDAKTTRAQALMLADSEATAKKCGDLSKSDPPPGDPSNPSDPSNPGGSNPGDTAPGGQQAGTGMDSMGPMLQAALPMLMQALTQQGTPTTQPQSLEQLTCDQNPNMPNCLGAGQKTTDSWNDPQGTAEAKQEPQGSGDFNLQDTSDIPMPQSLGETTQTASANIPTVNGVPNGGGGMPGGGGGGAASLGGGGGGGGGAQLGNKADILHGTQSPSGNFGQTNEKMNMKSGEGGGGYNYNGGLHEESMNLADFLPGGKNDPTKRNVAGIGPGTTTTNFQIQAKDVNIWNRISERIKSRCSQGLLRDCIP